MKRVCVIGGGASGMAAAIFLARGGAEVTLLERGSRLGRKLSATGNGQGNISNVHLSAEHYFSDDVPKVARALSAFGAEQTVAFFEGMGGIFLPDSRGRIYPASRQASAVTDLLRREIARLNVHVLLETQATGIVYERGLSVTWVGGKRSFDAVLLAAGGRAAPNFGTDGSAYALAEGFGHSVTALSPALVQLRCDAADVRGLKGIRVDGGVKVVRDGKIVYESRGDVLFADASVSGDAVFRASSYAREADMLLIDLLPDVSAERLMQCVDTGEDGLLCVVNNGLGRALLKRAKTRRELVALLKAYPVTVRGTAGFERAQVTRGGVPLKETGENLESVYRKGLYFAGEVLNVDGECGGYNLQWAWTSAYLAAQGILNGGDEA